MATQSTLDLTTKQDIARVEEFKFESTAGRPTLFWQGKRPFRSTVYYPAQHKETYGEEVDGWLNSIFWGDNLQVMSHLLKKFRGQIKLIYIDPPFDSKVDYKKTISLKGISATNDSTVFEEKQYSDLWNNDEYLQFLYERLILLRELLAKNGSIWIHCDSHRNSYIRVMLDEVFGPENFLNDITWVRSTNPKGSQHKSAKFDQFTDTILLYRKGPEFELNTLDVRAPLSEEEILEKYYRTDDKGRYYDGPIVRSMSMGTRPTMVYEYKGFTPPPCGWRVSPQTLKRIDEEGNLGWTSNNQPFRKLRPQDDRGHPVGNIWNDISLINSQSNERLGYPTQKPEKLLERIIRAGSEPGDLVFDCFMGSGTTLAAAMKLGRRFMGADINLGAVQTTTKRLLRLKEEVGGVKQLQMGFDEEDLELNLYTGFSVHNVNHYDVFRNPVQARDLLIEALELQPLPSGSVFDAEQDGFMVKIMPVNRIATKADLRELVMNIDQREWMRRRDELGPNKPVEHIRLICMGHDPDLGAELERELSDFKLKVEVVDILRDRGDLEFKRDAQADIKVKGDKLIIRRFYPMNLLQKLSLQKEKVSEWRELVESVMIDFNYDGAVLQPQILDIPEGKALVQGEYTIPANAGTIRVKITDLLSESLEMTLPDNG
jgi:site-specific DNA-methyltransferase (adenine-specific)/adenine-specific DNA-methyltransferase